MRSETFIMSSYSAVHDLCRTEAVQRERNRENVVWLLSFHAVPGPGHVLLQHQDRPLLARETGAGHVRSAETQNSKLRHPAHVGSGSGRRGPVADGGTAAHAH